MKLLSWFMAAALFSFLIPIAAQASSTAAPRAMPLPRGVPEFASSEGQCFASGEKDQYLRSIPRVRVAGCANPVVAPQKYLHAYGRAVPGNGGEAGAGTLNSCEATRKDHFSSYYTDVFLQELVAMVDKDTVGTNAECAANMIHLWASNAAITNSQSNLKKGQNHATDMARAWHLGGVASAYFKSWRVQSKLTPAREKVVLNWMKTLAYDVQENVVKGCVDGCGKGTNRQYWAAYAILPVGLLTKDEMLIKESERVFLQALNHIELNQSKPSDSGFLPKELLRGSKAQNYHSYSLQPLLAMAVVSKAYGCDFTGSSWREGQLSNLLRKTIQGHYNPKIFQDEVMKRRGQTAVQKTVVPDHLLYFAYEASPKIYNNVQTFLRVHETGTAAAADGRVVPFSKIFARTYGPTGKEAYGADFSQDRLGGRFYGLAFRAEGLKKNYPGCPARIWQDK